MRAHSLGASGTPTLAARPTAARQEHAPRPVQDTERYSDIALIGAGAMGQVILTRDRDLGRDLATKRMRPALKETRPDLVERFLREGRIQAQLSHPGVVPVHEVGIDETGQPFIQMDHVEGVTLYELLEKLRSGDRTLLDKWPVRERAKLVSRLAQTMAFAHDRGVVHRDLKPANIMVGHFGELYVLDWGIAKVMGDVDERAGYADRDQSGVIDTRDGYALGTPGYLPPEQARGRLSQCGPRADVYALGAILFEALTLRPLHRGETPEELLNSTLADPSRRPSDRSRSPALMAFDAVCEVATSPDPAARFTARGLHQAIEVALNGAADEARQKALADECLERAKEQMQHNDMAGRRRVVQEVMRYVALGGDRQRGARYLARALQQPLEAPYEPEAAMQLQAAAMQRNRAGLGYASLLYAIWFGASILGAPLSGGDSLAWACWGLGMLGLSLFCGFLRQRGGLTTGTGAVLVAGTYVGIGTAAAMLQSPPTAALACVAATAFLLVLLGANRTLQLVVASACALCITSVAAYTSHAVAQGGWLFEIALELGFTLCSVWLVGELVARRERTETRALVHNAVLQGILLGPESERPNRDTGSVG